MATLTSTSEDTTVYELCVLYPPSISQKEEQEILKDIEHILEEASGKQMTKDLWGARGLAYTYVVYHYELDPSKIREIDTALRISHGVLRHMFVKPPKGYEVSKFSEGYKEWLANRETKEEETARKKEEKLQKKVVDRAKRAVKKVEEQKKEDTKEATKAPIKESDITEGLEKIISDDDLDI
jgi:ribosomal protein S6